MFPTSLLLGKGTVSKNNQFPIACLGKFQPLGRVEEQLQSLKGLLFLMHFLSNKHRQKGRETTY